MRVNGIISSGYTLVKMQEITSALSRSIFFVIILIKLRDDFKYKWYAIFSLVNIFAFYFFFTRWIENSSFSLFASFSMIGFIGALFFGSWIAVDPTRRLFPKFVLLITSIVLFLFMTPGYNTVAEIMVRFFGNNHEEYAVAYNYFIIFKQVVIGVWVLFQATLVRRINYL